MPRQPTMTGERISPLLLPHVVMQGVQVYGGEVERVMACRTNHHFYTVSIRTRPVNREFQKVRLVKVSVPAEEGVVS
jgi:hypothetical protein